MSALLGPAELTGGAELICRWIDPWVNVAVTERDNGWLVHAFPTRTDRHPFTTVVLRCPSADFHERQVWREGNCLGHLDAVIEIANQVRRSYH